MGMSDELGTIKLAAVQAASVHLDRDASVEKACRFIHEAGKAGANVIGFPEGFIPAHPSWYTVRPATDLTTLGLSQKLFQNAVVIPSEATARLATACRDANITAVIGVCEKRPDTTGTMFNTQLFIDANGAILGKHQKLMPTVGERLVHTGGWGDTLCAFPAAFGALSGMICTENANPLATATITSFYPLVHVAAWPAFLSPAHDLSSLISAVSRGLAVSMGCYVINATGVLDQATIDAYEVDDEVRKFLEKNKNRGYASIISPSGQVLTEPLVTKDGEGIVYADVDLDAIMIPKLITDFAGHYNRPDVFSLTVNTSAPKLVTAPRNSGSDPIAPAPVEGVGLSGLSEDARKVLRNMARSES
jgi:aliphatic nitrilase